MSHMVRLMIESLETGLADLHHRPVRVRELVREPLATSSSFRTERLRVTLDRGSPLRIFFKDLHPDHLMTKARTVRGHDFEPSRREVRMYQSILSPERFGTLRLYACRWEPDDGRIWVFLEDGGRTVLHNYLDLPLWTAAARWAARFHVATHALPAETTAFLPRFDAAHYARCAERVTAILPGLEPAERELVERGLDAFSERMGELLALPPCVLHGQFFGKNIMLRRRKGGPRIVVIDWETAAVGPGLFDLVSLTSGKWTPEQRDAMWTAYVEAHEAETGCRVDRARFRRQLTVVAIYQALEWLAWWGHHRALSRHFGRFLRELDLALADAGARGAARAARAASA